jgi:hypothetical protein
VDAEDPDDKETSPLEPDKESPVFIAIDPDSADINSPSDDPVLIITDPLRP